MSTMNTARYEQFLRRLFRLVEGGVLPRMQNDVSPVIQLEDPADDALLFWKGHRLANGSATGTSDAAEFPACSLFNPLGSGILVWVRQINVRRGSNDVSVSFTQDRTGTVSSNLFFSDGRASLSSVPKAELGFDSLAARPTPEGFRVAFDNSSAASNLSPRFVLPPGVGLVVTGVATAALCSVSFEWIERTAEDSELKTL